MSTETSSSPELNFNPYGIFEDAYDWTTFETKQEFVESAHRFADDMVEKIRTLERAIESDPMFYANDLSIIIKEEEEEE